MSLDCGRKPEYPEGNPHRHRETQTHANSHRERPQPSCCEANSAYHCTMASSVSTLVSVSPNLQSLHPNSHAVLSVRSPLQTCACCSLFFLDHLWTAVCFLARFTCGEKKTQRETPKLSNRELASELEVMPCSVWTVQLVYMGAEMKRAVLRGALWHFHLLCVPGDLLWKWRWKITFFLL